MAIVRLGKMPLRWCKECDLPILEWKRCSKCNNPTSEVRVTPPGDVRPAFHFDIEMISGTIDRQFGAGCGQAVLGKRGLVLLNRCPSLDRMDEVILGGKVIGALIFDLDREGSRFIPRMEAALAIMASKRLDRGWVKIDAGAISAIKGGANALAPGILEAHPDIRWGDETLILTSQDEVIGVGPARMSGTDMVPGRRGVAVKTRWCGDAEEIISQDRSWEGTLEEVLEANRDYMENKIGKAIRFVKRTIADQGLPVTVSYSGGKDSLVTLLLVLEAGVRPKVIFIDTGLELDETVENVNVVCRSHDLELLVEKAGEAFWEALPMFGPPARDFRWCCKTCKLGPVSRLIAREFPEGVLAFIGQRSYESFQRKGKGSVWRNPWVASQVGASPIQDWPALLIWLFLFSRNAEVNPLYRSGHARIGCWLCPATDLGDMGLLEHHPHMERWQRALKEYAEERGLPEGFLSKALWRWRRLPKGLKEYADHFRPTKVQAPKEGELRLVLAKGYSPCTGGLSVEGAFTGPLDMKRVGNLLCSVGKVEAMEGVSGALVVDGMTDVFPEGAIVVRGKDERAVDHRVEAIKRAILRAMNCVGCGVCIGRCPERAIGLVDGVAVIDPEICTACGKCSKRCPVTDFAFRDEEIDI